MTSKKIYYLLFLFVFFITKVNAQFVGYYKMDDEGLDIPTHSLFILPDNKFYFFKYGSWKTGKWKEVDKDNIQLTEIKSENNSIEVYGKSDQNKKEIAVNLLGYLNGSLKTYAFINFSKDIISQKKFQPVFNVDEKLRENSYVITKKNEGYNWLTFSIPANKNKVKYEINYPLDAVSYAFPVDKKYNYYYIIENIDSVLQPVTLTLTKQNNAYYIDVDRYIKQKELTAAETLKKIEDAKITAENESYKKNFGTKIPYHSVEKITINESSVLTLPNGN
ncbi:hypothetical protein [Chryseobacterium schmidteae]|uniref:hypothetical protein n=1 Tax=Chryseobacterium schmidteae TaxID=2730404 RepID=UPI001589DCC4|nr:hypothetical protein [Chryseobacterium schmidteae]